MSRGSMVRAELVATALALAVTAAPPAAAQSLGGESRASFMKNVSELCMRNAAADPDIGKVSTDTLRSVCRCSAAYVADHATAAQLDRPDSLALRATIAQAISACLARRRLG